MMSPAFWWALVGIVLMICELAVPGLILFFFGLGALVYGAVGCLGGCFFDGSAGILFNCVPAFPV